jgi:hypothetical protein
MTGQVIRPGIGPFSPVTPVTAQGRGLPQTLLVFRKKRLIEEAIKMSALATDKLPKTATHPAITAQALGFERAAARVMLGAPPAAVAADLGCDVATLMRWVKAHRRLLRRAIRESAPDNAPDNASDEEAADHVVRSAPTRLRGSAERQFLADRPVAPENSAVVEAAYRAAEFDYSGRRVRAAAASH